MLKGDKKHIDKRLPSLLFQLSPAVISNIHENGFRLLKRFDRKILFPQTGCGFSKDAANQQRSKNADDIADHAGGKGMSDIFHRRRAIIYG